ncbi:hypothetical protein CAPTEDRAFT_200734 [Capitella teleta]|uniref:PIK3AP1 Toll/interleukin-1 receptor domain-containing protein n=1 Tax=Capitella teleta TaxID=283909 RepID=R7V0P5_CAPTE|nr:hypothetical protein CAPTEDRAFT_200734 [Capitella teleta]|eukprot:ELU09256.1 hypothetical protein CAPTEDRAFT_200734 [Capitella teleta]
MPADIVILHSSDADQWAEFLRDQMKQLGRKVACFANDDFLIRESDSSHREVNAAKSVLLIVSPYLFDTITANPSLTFVPLLKDTSKVVMFLCGIELRHFRQAATLHQFPDLGLFQKFTHRETIDMIECTLLTADQDVDV